MRPVASREMTRLASSLQERAQRDDHQDIEADDTQGECAVDQRAVDDEVYVPQFVAQDREANGQWDEKKADGRDSATDESIQCVLLGKRWEDQWKEMVDDIDKNRSCQAEHEPFGLLALLSTGYLAIPVDLRESQEHKGANRPNRPIRPRDFR